LALFLFLFGLCVSDNFHLPSVQIGCLVHCAV
jgi:hypothetical protein